MTPEDRILSAFAMLDAGSREMDRADRVEIRGLMAGVVSQGDTVGPTRLPPSVVRDDRLRRQSVIAMLDNVFTSEKFGEDFPEEMFGHLWRIAQVAPSHVALGDLMPLLSDWLRGFAGGGKPDADSTERLLVALHDQLWANGVHLQGETSEEDLRAAYGDVDAD